MTCTANRPRTAVEVDNSIRAEIRHLTLSHLFVGILEAPTIRNDAKASAAAVAAHQARNAYLEALDRLNSHSCRLLREACIEWSPVVADGSMARVPDTEEGREWIAEANRIQALPETAANADRWNDHSLALHRIGGEWV